MKFKESGSQGHTFVEIALKSTGHQKPIFRPPGQCPIDPSRNFFSRGLIRNLIQTIQDPKQATAGPVPQILTRRFQFIRSFFTMRFIDQKLLQTALFLSAS